MSDTPHPSETRAERRERERREAYYSASQWTLIWWRFRRHRAAMVASTILGLMILLGLFAEFFAPYGPTERNREYLYGAPQMPVFCDHNGCSLRPFVHGTRTERDPVTLRSRTVPDPEVRRYLRFLVPGQPAQLLGVFPTQTRLFGLDEGRIHLWGTDDLGRDVFSRTLYATRTSLSIGVLGVIISFVLALAIGSIAGYAGGLTDSAIQRVTEVVRVIPVIPLYMGLAAAMPREWSGLQVYFAMTVILGAVGWPTLARRVRSQRYRSGARIMSLQPVWPERDRDGSSARICCLLSPVSSLSIW